MNTKLYIDFIKAAIKAHGYKVADSANKKALEDKKITTAQYCEAASLIAKAFLSEQP